MVVIIVERAPVSLRGDLTRWLLEAKAGVFVGSVSGMVRDRLWERTCQGLKGGAALMAHSSDTEQGFRLRFWGDTSRLVEDFEGLSLIRIPQNQ